MRTKAKIGPFMKLILTQAARRSDASLKDLQDSAARVGNCLRLMRLLAVAQTLVESQEHCEAEDIGLPCFQLRRSGS